MRITNWLKEVKISPIYVIPGDSISISYEKDGKTTEVAFVNITESYVFDEVRIFEGQEGTKDGLGGVLLGRKT